MEDAMNLTQDPSPSPVKLKELPAECRDYVLRVADEHLRAAFIRIETLLHLVGGTRRDAVDRVDSLRRYAAERYGVRNEC